jgi:hypothetical protein
MMHRHEKVEAAASLGRGDWLRERPSAEQPCILHRYRSGDSVQIPPPLFRFLGRWRYGAGLTASSFSAT